LKLGFPVSTAKLCNALEDESGGLKVRNGTIDLEYAPCQIISVIVR
jgi:hypothetical protein